jgi:hypothetical protein
MHLKNQFIKKDKKDNPTKKKVKQITKFKTQFTKMLNNKLKKSIYKKGQKKRTQIGLES